MVHFLPPLCRQQWIQAAAVKTRIRPVTVKKRGVLHGSEISLVKYFLPDDEGTRAQAMYYEISTST
jgi:hypothetical protein